MGGTSACTCLRSSVSACVRCGCPLRHAVFGAANPSVPPLNCAWLDAVVARMNRGYMNDMEPAVQLTQA